MVCGLDHSGSQPSKYILVAVASSTVYIGIAVVYIFTPYIREIQFLLSVQVNSTSDDFTAYKMSKQNCIYIFH